MENKHNEEWKDIAELENAYQISNLGRVKRKGRRVLSSIQPCGYRVISERISTLQDNGKGYLQIYVSIKKKRTILYIHRLVCLYFNDNKEDKAEVNHIDGDKSNNKFDNLEWVSRIENVRHSYDIGLSPVGEKSVRSKLTEKKGIAIRRLYSINPKFNRLKLSKRLNVSDTTLHKIIKRKSWRHV